MDELNRVLGDHGAGMPVVASNGSLYSLGCAHRENKAKFAHWMASNALAAVRGEKARMLAEALASGADEKEARQRAAQEYDELLDMALAKIAAGKFAWGSIACQEALNDGPGMSYMTYLLLQAHHPSTTVEQAAALVNDSTVEVAKALRELLKSDPNSLPPAARPGAQNG
jgi:hypothetical protein